MDNEYKQDAPAAAAVAEKERKGLSPKAKRRLKSFSLLTVLILGTVFCVIFGFQRMKNSCDNARQRIYGTFYQKAYEAAEARNHVSNDLSIHIEDVQAVSRLEVLVVSGSEFVIKNADDESKVTSWLEVKGTGIFTVDLSAGEFIVDQERQYVLVRIPRPALTQCTVDGTGKQFYKDGRFLANGSVAEGVNLSTMQMKEGRIKLEDAMKQNRNFHEAAKEAAIQMTEWLVREWNPNVLDIQIEVQFIEV